MGHRKQSNPLSTIIFHFLIGHAWQPNRNLLELKTYRSKIACEKEATWMGHNGVRYRYCQVNRKWNTVFTGGIAKLGGWRTEIIDKETFCYPTLMNSLFARAEPLFVTRPVSPCPWWDCKTLKKMKIIKRSFLACLPTLLNPLCGVEEAPQDRFW